MGKMKAALLYGVKDLRLEDVDIPEVGPGEILVRVRAATTCGTDLKIYKRGYVGGIIKYPQPFGHEWAGDVVKVGEGVQGIEEGMRIRAGNSTPCYKCPMCQKGLYNLCENRTWLWGSYAEYVKVPSPIVKHNLHIIPPNLSYAEAAITEPLACVLHGALKAGIKLGDTVVVIGAGPIGILH
ncbi:MAG: dehydrogenase, partial [Thermoproteota archaeon]